MSQAPIRRFWFNWDSGRYAIGEIDLHCGNCFKILTNPTPGAEAWIHLRIEHSNSAGGWYPVGTTRSLESFIGLRASLE